MRHRQGRSRRLRSLAHAGCACGLAALLVLGLTHPSHAGKRHRHHPGHGHHHHGYGAAVLFGLGLIGLKSSRARVERRRQYRHHWHKRRPAERVHRRPSIVHIVPRIRYVAPEAHVPRNVAVRQPTMPPPDCLMIREYQTRIVIGGREVDAYGDACLQPDGSWRRAPPMLVPR